MSDLLVARVYSNRVSRRSKLSMAATDSATVLRDGASLAGADLMPLFKAFRQCDVTLETIDTAFTRGKPVVGLPVASLQSDLEGLLGRPPSELFAVLGGDSPDRGQWDALAHLAIKLANSYGSPTVSAHQPAAPVTTHNEPTNSGVQDKTALILEEQKRLREELLSLKKKRKVDDVDDALEQVRTAYRRVNLTGPGTLFAAIDTLIESADNTEHPKKNYFRKAREKLRAAESQTEDLGLLCAALFGDPDEQKVNANFYKYQKLVRMVPPSPARSAETSLPHPPFPPPYPYGYQSYNPAFRGGRRGGRRPLPQFPDDRGNKTCYTCHKKGHFARDCPEGK